MNQDFHRLKERVQNLPCWSNPVIPEPLAGGLTNINFVVQDGANKYVVRTADDIPIHGVQRSQELSASIAAAKADVSPSVLYSEPGVLVIEFIEGKTLSDSLVRDSEQISRIVPLLTDVHKKIPKHLDIPALMFWVFHVNQNYLNSIDPQQCHLASELNSFSQINQQLESLCAPFIPVFGHNDLLAANFIDDGQKIWLIDWEYSGFTHPLFDLAGLASNNQFIVEDENWLLEVYFEEKVTEAKQQQLSLMKCASLLRETLWSLVSAQHLKLDVDYVGYADENHKRFLEVYEVFKGFNS